MPRTPHACPHSGKHQTGMEVCRECGDYANCEECGAEYIARDMAGIKKCYPCWQIHDVTHQLENMKKLQEQRKAMYLKRKSI